MRQHNISIIGAGIYGLCLADFASRRGAEVAIFDDGHALRESNGSSGETRLFRETTIEDRGYVELARASRKFFTELQDESVEVLFEPTGFAFAAEPGALHQRHHSSRNVFDKACSIATDAGISFETLSGAEFTARFPAMSLDPESHVFFEATAGTLMVDRINRALRLRLERRGVRFFDGESIDRVDVSGDTVSVRSSTNCFESDYAIFATGSGSIGRLAESRVYTQPVSWFESDSVAPFPALVATRANAPLTFGFPPLPGYPEAKIVLENTSVNRSENGAREYLDSLRHQVSGLAHDFVPSLGHVTREAWADYVVMPGSRLTLRSDKRSNRITYIAGCSGHGYKLAPGASSLAVDAILRGVAAESVLR